MYSKSSNVNEVIRAVLDFLFIFFFLQKDFTRTKRHEIAQKSKKNKTQKSVKKTQPSKRTKRK